MRTLILSVLFVSIFFACDSESDKNPRNTVLFTDDWKFHLGDTEDSQAVNYDDQQWRALNLPHDWSIEGKRPSGDSRRRSAAGRYRMVQKNFYLE
jgi:beta-galactosidase